MQIDPKDIHGDTARAADPPGGAFRSRLAQGVVIALALALVLSVPLTDEAWLRRHFLPEFFAPRAEQQRWLTIIHGLALALAIALWAWVRPLAGRFVGRRTIGGLALDVGPTVLAIILALGASELLLRHLPWLAIHQKPGHQEPRRRADTRLGWEYVPNRAGRVQVAGRTVEYAFDASGRRVRARGETLDPARPTILFTGESIISGDGLPYDQSIPAQVAARLGFQAANIAVGGYATDQAYLRLKDDLPNFQRPVAVVILFMPLLFHRNLEHDRPHLDRDLAWRSSAQGWRLLRIFQRVVPYRSLANSETGVATTQATLRATIDLARARGAVPLILVPQLTPETAEERVLRERILQGLPSLVVPVDPSWHLPGNRHPDARGAEALATAVADALRRRLAGSDPA